MFNDLDAVENSLKGLLQGPHGRIKILSEERTTAEALHRRDRAWIERCRSYPSRPPRVVETRPECFSRFKGSIKLHENADTLVRHGISTGPSRTLNICSGLGLSQRVARNSQHRDKNTMQKMRTRSVKLREDRYAPTTHGQ